MASCQPYIAPACVDEIKCEPPIAAVAIKIPGPKMRQLKPSCCEVAVSSVAFGLVRGLLSGCVVMNTSKWLKRQIITYLCQLANDHERMALQTA